MDGSKTQKKNPNRVLMTNNAFTFKWCEEKHFIFQKKYLIHFSGGTYVIYR